MEQEMRALEADEMKENIQGKGRTQVQFLITVLQP